MQTRLLLIRHAHVDTGARLCGTLDLPLSASGRAQLDTLLQGRAAHPPQALYSSPLARARTVAAGLADAWKVPLYIDDRVREICCGSLEGIRLDQLERYYPVLWTRNLAQADEDFGWPGGETYRAFRERVMAGLGAIASAHPGERIAVVTHAGVITQVLGAIRGRSAAVWDAERPGLLTGTEIAWSHGGPQAVLGFNLRDWY